MKKDDLPHPAGRDTLPTLVQAEALTRVGTEPTRVSTTTRWSLLIVGFGLAIPWLIAVTLTPDHRGWGTHQQLGLPPCTIQRVFGHRCPACGMTTAFAHLARGGFGSALQCSVSGTVVGILTALAIPWTWATAWRGQWWRPRPAEPAWLWAAWGLCGLILVEWIVRLTVPFSSGS